MPPRIRTRASRALKENIDVTGNNVKSIKNISKVPRKPLADKTNSASDDASLEISKKSKKINTKTVKVEPKGVGHKKQNATIKENCNSKSKLSQQKENVDSTNEERPRRNRQLPKRFVQNQVLNNLSNSRDTSVNVTHNSSKTNADNTPAKNDSKSDQAEPSLFKTPAKADSSLLASRPRRICRLPSRFEDHSVSPNKFIPLQPANASTPIQESKIKSSAPIPVASTSASIQQSKRKVSIHPIDNKDVSNKDLERKQAPKEKAIRLAKLDALQKVSSDNSSDKSSPDSNNNAKGRSTRQRTVKTQKVNKKPSPIKNNKSPIRKFLTPMNKKQTFLTKKQSPVEKIQSPLNNKRSFKKVCSEPTNTNKKLINKNLSFKVLENKTDTQDSKKSGLDIYEFTFDPDEEPQPQKKKRKKPVAKKQSAKPKKDVYKSIYDQNISKALAALKNVVKSGKTVEAPKLAQRTENCETDSVETQVEQKNAENNVNKVQNTNVIKDTPLNDTGKNSVHECNNPSIRVEDIAADIQPITDNYDDINYSPVNSPRSNVPKSPDASVNPGQTPERHAHNNDPLNLLEDLSFFDDQPVASSSMNVSVRHPLASPWRVEFGSLPIKWPNNTYVKPNMTPAVESSFISSEDTIKKKHVYTNMVPQTNDMFTEIVDNTPNLKQTSIISFIKEMAEKSAKKKRQRSVSPTKAIYEGIVAINMDGNKNKKSTKKATGSKPTHTSNTTEEVSSSGNDTSHEKENSAEEANNRKRKNDDDICDVPAKSPRKQKDKDCTYFGFDESENLDTENVSPIKNKNKGRSLRSQSRAVLKEINGPTRAVLPVAAKTKIPSSDAVNKVYDEVKSAADAPMFPDKEVVDNGTNIEDPICNEDSQSVHLFEDIEFIHHLKPTRKSYGKAKKVTFRQRSTSDSDTQEPIVAEQNESSDYDDLGDLTFEIPNVQEKKTMKKKKSKKQRTKKEEQEAEAWAANFNSMCEDIEEFPLLVE